MTDVSVGCCALFTHYAAVVFKLCIGASHMTESVQ